MMRSLYSGVAGLRTHQTRMDVVGNNISNVNTYAYKSQRATFRDLYYQTIRGASNGKNAMQLGYGAQVGSVDTLHMRAGYSPTDRPQDLYIDGEGFLVVKDPKSGSKMYTRVGALSFMPTLEADGKESSTFKVVDINGNPVLGLNATEPNFTTTPPTAGKIDPTLYNGGVAVPAEGPSGLILDDEKFEQISIPDFAKYTDITIGADGIITGVRDDMVHELGAISIARISNPEGLTAQGNSYYKAIKNTGIIDYAIAGSNGVGGLVTGALEMSNVDLAKEFTEMITTQRGYQANSRIISVVDSMLEELVNLKR
jgi:flagellar hook protein FlgE